LANRCARPCSAHHSAGAVPCSCVDDGNDALLLMVEVAHLDDIQKVIDLLIGFVESIAESATFGVSL
jgi:putative aminopeptidase FrvX